MQYLRDQLHPLGVKPVAPDDPGPGASPEADAPGKDIGEAARADPPVAAGNLRLLQCGDDSDDGDEQVSSEDTTSDASSCA